MEITFDEGQEGELLPRRVRLALYRIYQVSLNNIAKHSLSTQVKVCFEKTMEEAVLRSRTPARGSRRLRIGGLARQGHLGLVGIEERAELWREAEISRAPGTAPGSRSPSRSSQLRGSG